MAKRLVDFVHGEYYEVIVDYDKPWQKVFKLRDFDNNKYLLPYHPFCKDKEIVDALFNQCQGKMKKKLKIRIFNWEEDITYLEAIERIKKEGGRPLNIRELLTLNKRYPNPYLRFSIITALGSSYPAGTGDFVSICEGDVRSTKEIDLKHSFRPDERARYEYFPAVLEETAV